MKKLVIQIIILENHRDSVSKVSCIFAMKEFCFWHSVSYDFMNWMIQFIIDLQSSEKGELRKLIKKKSTPSYINNKIYLKILIAKSTVLA